MIVLQVLGALLLAYLVFELALLFGERIARGVGAFLIAVAILGAPFVALSHMPDVPCWAFCGP